MQLCGRVVPAATDQTDITLALKLLEEGDEGEHVVVLLLLLLLLLLTLEEGPAAPDAAATVALAKAHLRDFDAEHMTPPSAQQFITFMPPLFLGTAVDER